MGKKICRKSWNRMKEKHMKDSVEKIGSQN
ncbi:hypothetical protein S101395_02840 [Bacillus sonorensis]|uniref:Uncharacterized protein n=1 Tax=Bacillus sonorensis TaxID=119858 RepID=A0ABN5AMI1_9BACI|nr:hypothetical protein S101395_02840 [Bacillus sonorensis]